MAPKMVSYLEEGVAGQALDGVAAEPQLPQLGDALEGVRGHGPQLVVAQVQLHQVDEAAEGVAVDGRQPAARQVHLLQVHQPRREELVLRQRGDDVARQVEQLRSYIMPRNVPHYDRHRSDNVSTSSLRNMVVSKVTFQKHSRDMEKV